jgi:1,4-dihydroxy-6-naphthoate synthase
MSDSAKMTVALPGKYTTAAMLLQLYESNWQDIVFMRFDEIMPAIQAGKVDCGVIIHESRFTFGDMGLMAIVDLGAWWENMSGLPLPLGGIAVKRTLHRKLIEKIDRSLRASIAWAYQNREICSSYVREHAQELEESVIYNHIGLYVNYFTEDLGEEGLSAVDFFLEKGTEAGIFPNAAGNSLEILYK